MSYDVYAAVAAWSRSSDKSTRRAGIARMDELLDEANKEQTPQGSQGDEQCQTSRTG